jgi:phosphohistidine phosphatase
MVSRAQGRGLNLSCDSRPRSPASERHNACMNETRLLYIVRHAKSSWDDPAERDHERPLAPRGRRAAKLLSRYVQDSQIRPELVLCSTARRAVETLETIDPPGERAIESLLYRADYDQLLERLRQVPAERRAVMLVGHNPALQVLVLRLARSGEWLEDIRRKYPTGALATLEFAVPWSEIDERTGTLTGYVRPKALLHES